MKFKYKEMNSFINNFMKVIVFIDYYLNTLIKMEIFNRNNEKQLIIVPKSSFKNTSRNSLKSLFESSGYDKLCGDFYRRDQMTQGDIVLRGIKILFVNLL